MKDDLAQRFDNFLGGACQPDEFERELLALCRADPERAWRALGLLDQFYRRHRISEALCRRLRQNIGRHAMRLEGHTVEPERPVAPACTATAETSMEEALAEVEALLAAAPTPSAPPVSSVPPITSAPPVSSVPPITSAPPVTSAPPAITAPPAAMRPMAEQRDRPQRSGIRWRGFQTSPALGLMAIVLGVAGSTRMQDVPAPLAGGNDAIPVASASELREPEAPPGPGVISLSSDRYLVYPHQRTLEFTVERTTGGAGDAGFLWWTQPAGAKSSEDYIGTRARPAALPNGSEAMKLRIPILANPRRRHIEMFYVVIGKADGGADLGSIHRAVVFILPADST